MLRLFCKLLSVIRDSVGEIDLLQLLSECLLWLFFLFEFD